MRNGILRANSKKVAFLSSKAFKCQDVERERLEEQIPLTFLLTPIAPIHSEKSLCAFEVEEKEF